MWAFKVDYEECPHRALILGTNAIAFLIHLALLVYVAKIAYYISFQLRHPCGEMCWSCVEDPYPNVDTLDALEFQALEAQFHEEVVAKQLRAEKQLHPERQMVRKAMKGLNSSGKGIGAKYGKKYGKAARQNKKDKNSNSMGQSQGLLDTQEINGMESQDLDAQIALEELQYKQRSKSRTRREELAEMLEGPE